MPIVQVNVSQNVAPAPSLLQKTGALISQGGTTLAAGTTSLLRSAADVTALLRAALAISTIAWVSSVATITTVAPHGVTTGQQVSITVAGASPSGYNGTFLATSTGANTLTYPLVSNPGTNTVPGTYIAAGVAELQSMVTTFYAQGSQQSVYVLELGLVSSAAAVTALAAYITATTKQLFYSYLVPRAWSNEASYFTFLSTFSATTKRTYFFSTATLANYTSYLPTMKAALVLVEAPGIPATEFSMAAPFYVALNYAPSSTNKVTPFAYSYLYGVTPYPLTGNATTLTALTAANVNHVGTGAEGGLTNTILYYGTNMDGRAFNYWYAVDWAEITLDTDIAAAVINGSNNPTNPLYYDQSGIDRLQGVGAGTLGRGSSWGIVNGAPVQVAMTPAAFQDALDNGDFAGKSVINAYPFIPYSIVNPNDYAQGLYSGLQVAFVPQTGFKHIVIGLTISDFVAR